MVKKLVILASMVVFAAGLTGCKDEDDGKKTTKNIVYSNKSTEWREEVDEDGNVVAWEAVTETESGRDVQVLWEDETFWR